MGFRFGRSVRILPGVRLNFSTRGISTSIGGRGATINVGRHGTRATVGLPGTGLSYSTRLFRGGRQPRPDPMAAGGQAGASLIGWVVIIGLILLVGSCFMSSGSPPEVQPAASILTAPALPMRTLLSDKVNCRASPISGAVLYQLDKSERVSVTEQAQGWTKVTRPGGDCWIADRFLGP